jgi:peptidoglycan pentaglycine glycine transferase (the first glycine)
VALETIWTSKLNARDAADYDRFVLDSTGGHFAQTRAWAAVAERSRPCRARFFLAREAGRIVGTALVLRAHLGPVALPFARVDRGPVCARTTDVKRVVQALSSLGRRKGVARLAVMPYWAGEDAAQVERDLQQVGFRDVQQADGSHAATLRLVLENRSDDQVLAGSERAHLRHLLREASRSGAVVRTGERRDFEAHTRLVAARLRSAGKRDRSTAWYDALWRWLDGERRGRLFACHHSGTVVATVIALRHGALATYAFGASLPGNYGFSKSILPLVAAIRWARSEGCSHFDLGGIPLADDRDSKRAGIAHYKLHFTKIRVPLVREHRRWF